MGSDVVGVVIELQDHYNVKVNRICLRLTKILDRINSVLPAIESARRGCTSGILELCSLNNSIDKAKLLLQHNAESSKLYLAITGEATLARCERIRSSLIQSLCQLQNMVLPSLASKIVEVLNYPRFTMFKADSSVEEAGRALLDLLRQTGSGKDVEFEAFQIAASRLKLTSHKDILIERRSLNKLLDKLNGSDTKKEKILNYFLYLLKKHDKNVRQHNHEHKEHANAGSKNFVARHINSTSNTGSSANDVEPSDQGAVPPEEFCCPISSRLMYDPMVIASGQTYERMCIEKWFAEGHDTCPKTQRKLANLSMVPNSCMMDLIANWCMKCDINIPEPCSRCSPLDLGRWEPSHGYSMSSLKNVSVALLDGSMGHCIVENNHRNASFISSDANYYSDSCYINGIADSKDDHAHLFSWNDDYQQ